MRKEIFAGLVSVVMNFNVMASAEEAGSGGVEFYPNMGIGINSLEFVRTDGTRIDASYTTYNVGLNMSYKSFYATLLGELDGSDFKRRAGEVKSIEREDYTASFGYAIASKTSAFLGYTWGEVKDDFLGDFHQDKGWYVGASQSFPYESSTLSISLAYADLKGQLSNDDDGSIVYGETTGFSVTCGWSGPFRRDMGYFVNLRLRRYEFEIYNSTDVTDKDITSLSAGIVF